MEDNKVACGLVRMNGMRAHHTITRPVKCDCRATSQGFLRV